MHTAPPLNRGALIAGIMAYADSKGHPISPSRAGRLATKMQRGDYDPAELAPVLQHADPTAELAVLRVMLTNE